MVNRGWDIHPTTVLRWVQEYSPEIDQRLRSELRPTDDWWRNVNQTYILVKGKQKYLYRAVHWTANTWEEVWGRSKTLFWQKGFCVRQGKAVHTSTPPGVTVDKNPAYPQATKELKSTKKLPEGVLRQSKDLNNIVNQDHPDLKRLVKPGMGFGFNTARQTIQGYEIINQMRQGRVAGVPRGAIKERVLFLHQIFGVVA